MKTLGLEKMSRKNTQDVNEDYQKEVMTAVNGYNKTFLTNFMLKYG